jgi:stress response protein SCP2
MLNPGQNVEIGGTRLEVVVRWQPERVSGQELDVSAFLLTASGKVASDADFVFYNQNQARQGAVSLAIQPGTATFTLDLGRLPADVEKIAFAATLHGGATVGALTSLRLTAGDAEFSPALQGRSEAALVLADVYRRGSSFKLRAVGQGFNGGLDPLARSYGVNVGEPAAPASASSSAAAPAPPAAGKRVSLEKKVAGQAPQLVNLAKQATVVLEKQRLQDVTARVGLVLDASGSMQQQYLKGRVQEVVERILTLAVHFDDDGALDVWAFGLKAAALTPVTLATVGGYINREQGGWSTWRNILGGLSNNEPDVIRAVMDKYAPGWKQGRASQPAALPAYVIFVSDGGVAKDQEIEQLLRAAAEHPVFWQFVGIGGRKYGILERLDTLSGRFVDNCNFFAIDDLHEVSEGVLYERLLNEFPSWLKEAKSKGLLR